MHPQFQTPEYLKTVLLNDKVRELGKKFPSAPATDPKVQSAFTWLLDMQLNRTQATPQHANLLQQAGEFSEAPGPDDGTAHYLTKDLAAKAIKAFKSGTTMPPISLEQAQALRQEALDRSKPKLAQRPTDPLTRKPARGPLPNQPEGIRQGTAQAETLHRSPFRQPGR